LRNRFGDLEPWVRAGLEHVREDRADALAAAHFVERVDEIGVGFEKLFDAVKRFRRKRFEKTDVALDPLI